MNKTSLHDTDGDGLIENSGFADQTYDAWPVKGPRYAFVTLFSPTVTSDLPFVRKAKLRSAHEPSGPQCNWVYAGFLDVFVRDSSYPVMEKSTMRITCLWQKKTVQWPHQGWNVHVWAPSPACFYRVSHFVLFNSWVSTHDTWSWTTKFRYIQRYISLHSSRYVHGV